MNTRTPVDLFGYADNLILFWMSQVSTKLHLIQLKTHEISIKESLNLIESVATIIAILVGGIWAYFKIIKGRSYRARLEITIDGRFVSYRQFKGIVVNVTLKNVGLSKVGIDRKRSTIEILSYPLSNYLPEFHNAFVKRIGVIKAIRMHDWIEPGEHISEERLIALPEDNVIAAVLVLRLLEARRFIQFGREESLWCSMTVLTR